MIVAPSASHWGLRRSPTRQWLQVCLLGIALLAGGCGFQLRGTQTASYRTLYLSGGLETGLNREIRQALTREAGLQLVSQPDKADVQVFVSPLVRSRQILTLNAQGTVSQFTLLSQLDFRANDHGGNEILPPTHVSIARLFNYNDVQILAKSSEEQIMNQDMQHELVREMVRRILALHPKVDAIP